jgi:regulator of protease activity HflC (stomatin/prohibitin superfamily)
MPLDSTKVSSLAKIIVVTAVFAVVVILGLSTFSAKTISGNQVGVRETWNGGVDPNPLPPKTYFYNRWTTQIYAYETSGQVYAMNDKDEPFAEGRRVDPLIVNSRDNQQVVFHILVTWRIDPGHVISLHKNYRDNIDERLLRPAIVKAVSVRATLQDAIDLYSGEKLNQLRTDVEHDLKDPNGNLTTNGIVVDSFVIEKPTFMNKEYVDNIEKRQVQIIIQSRAHEEQLANEALALAAKSAAQKSLNEQVVQADAAKQVAILQQEATAQQSIIQTSANAKNAVTQQEAESKKIVLAAQAEAGRQVAISEASKTAELNRAIAIEAVGKAQAAANQLLLTSYSVPGADLYTRIQVAQSFAQAINNVRFYPPNATFNTVASDFDKGLSLLVGQPVKSTTP